MTKTRHPLPHRSLVAWLLVVLLLALAGPIALADDDDDDYESFIDSIGKMLYFMAWPSAEYRGVTFGGATRVSGGTDLRVKIYGLSAFSGESLWTELVVEIRNDALHDIRWGRNNAILVQPGESIKAFGQAIAELNAEYQRSQAGSSPLYTPPPPPTGGSSPGSYHFTNSCHRPIRLAISYKGLDGDWHTDGWWNFGPNETAYLTSSGSRLKSRNSIWYFYAETTDGSSWKWAGDDTLSLRGTRLKMRKMQDKQGDFNWSTTCN